VKEEGMKITRTIGAFLLMAAPCFAQTDPMALPSRPEGEASFPLTVSTSPRFEKALRHQIDAIEAGQPDYDAMTAKTADRLRGQFAGIHPALAQQWGALISLKFRHSTPREDVYEARFEKARVQWIIAQNRQGKIIGIAFKTLS
jgi:hypothetical protein